MRHLLFKLILVCLVCFSPFSMAQKTPFGQTIQVVTYFKSIVGNPTWLFIIRDMNTGVVYPYLFDITKPQNYWIALTYGHAYRVTVSNLKFGPFAVINNFCCLENGVVDGRSMYVTLVGDLTPNPQSFKCKITQYRGN